MAKNLHQQRTPMSEQLRLITECRQSGLTDADWCRENDVNSSTFYSWLARCRKSACSAQIPPAGYGHSAMPEPRQDVVAIELVPDQLSESAAVSVPDQPEAHLDSIELFNSSIVAGYTGVMKPPVRSKGNLNSGLTETTLKPLNYPLSDLFCSVKPLPRKRCVADFTEQSRSDIT